MSLRDLVLQKTVLYACTSMLYVTFASDEHDTKEDAAEFRAPGGSFSTYWGQLSSRTVELLKVMKLFCSLSAHW